MFVDNFCYILEVFKITQRCYDSNFLNQIITNEKLVKILDDKNNEKHLLVKLKYKINKLEIISKLNEFFINENMVK